MQSSNASLSKRLCRRSLKNAIISFQSEQFSAACAYFCVAFQLSPNLIDKWKGTFLYSMDKHVNHLESVEEYDSIVKAFEEAIDALPQCEDIHYNFASFYYRRGHMSKAANGFLSTLSINPKYHLAHLSLENIRSSSIERWHFIMINDVKRNRAFKNAIKCSIEKGYDRVLDIGAGSGLLSLYAIESGAKSVVACEVSEMMYHMCNDVFECNGVKDRVTLINDMSTNLELSERVNLIVTEIFDAALFGERALSTIISASKKLLDSNRGMIVPNKAAVWGVILNHDKIRDCFCVSRKRIGNITIESEVIICVNIDEMKYTTFDLSLLNQNDIYLSDPFLIVDIDFNSFDQINQLMHYDYQKNVKVSFNKSGRFDAIGVWFDLKLIDDICISTQPPNQLIGWEQAIYSSGDFTDKMMEKDSEIEIIFKFNDDFMKLTDIQLKKQCNIKIDKMIYFKSEVIRYINAAQFHDNLISVIDSKMKDLNAVNIIDFSYFPISSIHCAFNSKVQNIVIVADESEVHENIKSFIQITNAPSEKLHLKTYESVLSEDNCQWNIVIADFIDHSGLMRSNLLEQLTYLKLIKNLRPLFYFPQKIHIVGVFVQSEDIIRKSRLIDDESIHGYEIAKFINVFETETLQNINLNTIEVNKLSDKFRLLTLNLDESVTNAQHINIEPHQNVTVKVNQSGQLHAVVYWYELYHDDNLIIDTISLGHNWNHAAFIIKNPLIVTSGDTINVSSTFTNGFLRLSLCN